MPPAAPGDLHRGSAPWTPKKVSDWDGAIQHPDQNPRENHWTDHICLWCHADRPADG